MKVAVIGAAGFVGSAVAAHLAARPGVELVPVTRDAYAQAAGRRYDVVVEAACNSKKFLADERPVEEFDLSVGHRLRTLRDFPAGLHVHLSSVDVYSDLTRPETTREDGPAGPGKPSNYGLHKRLAEEMVAHYAERWLVVRLAGMVGPGLRKNPVYDILRGQPLRIHPDSRYQFMATADVARVVWGLVEAGVHGEVFNVCGEGLISPREIAALAGRPLDLSLLPPNAEPRVVHACTAKIRRRTPLPDTRTTVAQFLGAHA